MSTVYLVDDDEAIRDSLTWLLRSRGIRCLAWDSAESFLADYQDNWVGCLLLDIRMEAMSGPELYERLLQRGCHMPTIFLTGHGDIPLAVKALKSGAFDFLEKPCHDNHLVDRINDALQLEEKRVMRQTSLLGTTDRLNSLTSREKEVMDAVLAGKLNKVIAYELDISMRTVEVHRARVFEKMGVKSAVELAQLLAQNLSG